MEENQSFFYFGLFPKFDDLLTSVNMFTDGDWLEYKERKGTGGLASAHSDTIPLIYNPRTNVNVLTYHKNYDYFADYINNIIQLVSPHLGDISVKQAMLTRLRAGAVIKTHKDVGTITAVSHRIHIPIKTNKDCVFTIENEHKHLGAGEMWMIDNVGRHHSVVNNGDTHREHLIVDLR